MLSFPDVLAQHVAIALVVRAEGQHHEAGLERARHLRCDLDNVKWPQLGHLAVEVDPPAPPRAAHLLERVESELRRYVLHVAQVLAVRSGRSR